VSFFDVSNFAVSFLMVSTLVFVVESIFTVVESPPVFSLLLPQAANDSTVNVIRAVLIIFFILLSVKCLQLFNARVLKR